MSSAGSQLRVGDKIISCNGITDPEDMVTCMVQTGRYGIRLKTLRRPYSPASPNLLSLPAARSPSIFDDPPEVAERERVRIAELEAKRDASRADYLKRQEEKAKVIISEDKSDLQSLIAERLAKSRGM